MIIGLIPTVGVLAAWQQKNTADRRNESWRRATWTFERTFSGDQEQRRLGWSLLLVLVGSKLVTKGESDFVQAVAEHVALESDDDDGEESGGVRLAEPYQDDDPNREEGAG